MHITALCPFCRSVYQVQATLRGQRMRCPNATCRKIFSVPAEEPPPQQGADTPRSPRSSPGNGQRSGSVGEIVPILPAEEAAPPQEPSETSSDWWQAAPPLRSQAELGNEKKEAPWWQNATPPVQTGERGALTPCSDPNRGITPPARPAAQTQPMPALPSEKPDQPRELPPGQWEPPPIRRGVQSKEQRAASVSDETKEDSHPPETTAVLSQEEHDNEGQPRLSKRRARLIIIGFTGITIGVLGVALVWVLQKFHKSEEELSAQAHALYDQGSYVNAAELFRPLAEKFPSSDHVEEYRFLADWCSVCSAVSDPDADLSAAAAQLEGFVKDHKKDPLMKQFGRDAGQRLLNLAAALAARNANPTDEQPLDAAGRIEQLRRTVAALRSDALTKDESEQIVANVAKVRRAVEQASKRRDVLKQLHLKNRETPMDAIKRARSLLARMERELPGISKDPEARTALAQLEETHFASVVYHPATETPPLPPPPPVDDAETLWFAPLVQTFAPSKAPANDPIVLALVRGVLYALKQTNGELKWAKRVGPDTTVLPLRVPASASRPELLLVLSADTQTLSALNVEGKKQWEYHVGQPVLGRPIIIEHRAYLADYSGTVHEIELSLGQLLGRWSLGQSLTCGGTRERDTSRIYFPADDSCVYVLDVKARRCVAILYDGHPSGSLRSEPIVIPPEGETAPGYLILNQSDGLDAMRLRVFELPLQDRHATERPLQPPARLTGWTWFAPKEDGEKLAVLSDAGILGLFGIRQLGNNDPPLFPLLQPGGLDLSPFLTSQARRQGLSLPRERGRAQVVQMQGDDLWVLAHGQLQKLRLGWNDAAGPQATPGWNEPLTLGSPLHEPQLIKDRNGPCAFLLVTQDLERQTCLASKVAEGEDEQGRILWQRQLGLVCRGEPLLLTPPGGGAPLLLALDQGGGLFVLDPGQSPDKPQRFLAPPLADNPLVSPRLLPAADGHSAYEIAAPGDGRDLIVRRIDWAGDQRQLRIHEREVSLRSLVRGKDVRTLAGPPVVAGSQLLIPMTDDTIVRLSLTDETSDLQTGPSWRSTRDPLIAPCSVLALGGDRFLSTNGNRRLSVYEWPPGKEYQQLPKDGEPLKPLEHLLAAPPVLLPSRDNQPPRIAVADSAGVLRLFTVNPDGALQQVRTWELPGNLTAGPFVQAAPEGWRIGCVLDRSRLLWIDPDKTEPLWIYSSGGPAILGPPQRIEDMLVAALQSGLYVGIDPSTGQAKGAGYTLRSSAAPAATPMPFGPGRMFAPLSDGTALLLSVKLLRQKEP